VSTDSKELFQSDRYYIPEERVLFSNSKALFLLSSRKPAATLEISKDFIFVMFLKDVFKEERSDESVWAMIQRSGRAAEEQIWNVEE